MDAAEEVIATCHTSCRIVCPKCGPERRHKNPTLSVTVESDRTLYKCHHCDWSGLLTSEDPLTKYRRKTSKGVSLIPTKLNQDQEVIRALFQSRGIAIKTFDGLPSMTTGERYFAKIKAKTGAVGFVYGPGEEPNAIKWRPADGRKDFTQDKSASTFYGLEQYPDLAAMPEGERVVVIVEGESDCIAMYANGIPALSVPNGAPMKVSKGNYVDPEEDVKFSYVWEARELFDCTDKIVLAVDKDQAGEALAEELARRLGRARCWRVQYPEGCKDATDVLVTHGADVMRDLIEQAEPMPLHGVYAATDYRREVVKSYQEGQVRGDTTGYSVIDDLFTIKEGMIYIVTGYPGDGKSEFCDQLMVNLALKRSWKWAVASFENQPAEHITKLSEKIIGKPFYEGPTPRMNRNEVDEAMDIINRHMVFLENRGGDMPTIKMIIDRAKQAVMRLGVRGLIIDPFNYIRLESENTNDGISEMLSEISTFAKAYRVAVFFVAHPVKVYPRDDGSMPVPLGTHISGSAAWWAKADVGFTVHRPDFGVGIKCWKVRHKWLGKVGDALLGYDVPTGRYFEKPNDFVVADKSLNGHNRQGVDQRSRDFNETKAEWDLEF